VVRKEVNNNCVTYYCIDDEQETNLFAQLNTLVKNSLDDENTSQENTAQLLCKIVLQVYFEINALVYTEFYTYSKTTFSYSFFLKLIIIEFDVPPC